MPWPTDLPSVFRTRGQSILRRAPPDADVSCFPLSVGVDDISSTDQTMPSIERTCDLRWLVICPPYRLSPPIPTSTSAVSPEKSCGPYSTMRSIRRSAPKIDQHSTGRSVQTPEPNRPGVAAKPGQDESDPDRFRWVRSVGSVCSVRSCCVYGKRFNR
jgi:hypothetical protein